MTLWLEARDVAGGISEFTACLNRWGTPLLSHGLLDSLHLAAIHGDVDEAHLHPLVLLKPEVEAGAVDETQ